MHVLDRGLHVAAEAFATAFWVAFFLILATLIPIGFLPRQRERIPAAEPQTAIPGIQSGEDVPEGGEIGTPWQGEARSDVRSEQALPAGHEPQP